MRKAIIKSRIRYYNKNQINEPNFDEKIITESISDYRYSSGENLEFYFNDNCSRQLRKIKKLDNMGCLSEFHL